MTRAVFASSKLHSRLSSLNHEHRCKQRRKWCNQQLVRAWGSTPPLLNMTACTQTLHKRQSIGKDDCSGPVLRKGWSGASQWCDQNIVKKAKWGWSSGSRQDLRLCADGYQGCIMRPLRVDWVWKATFYGRYVCQTFQQSNRSFRRQKNNIIYIIRTGKLRSILILQRHQLSFLATFVSTGIISSNSSSTSATIRLRIILFFSP